MGAPADAYQGHMSEHARRGHSQCHGVVHAHEVQDQLGAATLGDFTDLGGSIGTCQHAVGGPHVGGQCQTLGGGVHGDDLGGGGGSQNLDRHVAQPASGTDDHGGGARRQQVPGSHDGVVRGEAGIGERGCLHRAQITQ